MKIAIARLLSLFMSAALSAENANPANLTEREIIERMESVYANSHTYIDSGAVKIIFSGSGNQAVEKSFNTAFIQPDRFWYEFREKEPYGREQIFIIQLDGKNVQTYWNVQHDQKHDSLDRGVTAATGVSQGSAITVPAVLPPDQMTWRRAIRFSQPKRIDDEIFDNADRFRLQDLILNTIPVLIDRKAFLLRKIYREQEFEDFRTQETIVYRPHLNGDTADKSPGFNPPDKKR